MYSYASTLAANHAFEKLIEQQQAKLQAAIEEVIAPLMEEALQYLYEFVEGERRLAEEKFSRN